MPAEGQTVFVRSPLHVRFPPDRDQIADVLALRFRAISRSVYEVPV